MAKKLRLGDFTEKNEKISFDKPEIKTVEQLKTEESNRKRNEERQKYLTEKKGYAPGIITLGEKIPFMVKE